MGKLYFNGQPFTVEDRTLAHLRIVAMNKLRRSEGFMVQIPSEHATGVHSVWLAPSMPLSFQFYGSRPPRLEPEHVQAMMADANGPDGVDITKFLHEIARTA